jgi:hypothetical protein
MSEKNECLLFTGSLLVTDADSGTNADVSCSGASGSSSSTYYTIGADCNIYLSKSPDFATGTTVTYVDAEPYCAF